MRTTIALAVAIAVIALRVSAQTYPEQFESDLIEAFENSNRSEEDYLHFEWEGYDGWYNNPAHPDWGGAGI